MQYKDEVKQDLEPLLKELLPNVHFFGFTDTTENGPLRCIWKAVRLGREFTIETSSDIVAYLHMLWVPNQDVDEDPPYVTTNHLHALALIIKNWQED